MQTIGYSFTGASADIFKCFDQLIRVIIDHVLQQAGMPHGIRTAYVKYIDNLKVVNTVAGGIGEAYSKPTGIPQGDPFSMMVVALLSRAWIMQMRDYDVTPRVLADDLLILATDTEQAGGHLAGNAEAAQGHLAKAVAAFDATHGHLQDLGAKIAPKKCYAFTSCTTSRSWLRQHRWGRLDKVITVVNDTRDLGAHLNATVNKMVGTTLTQRMIKMTTKTNALNMHKADYDKKAAIIRGKLIPAAIYGCETAPVNEAALRGLRTSIVDTLAYTTKRRSPDLTFACCSRGRDADPDSEIVVKRTLALRRSFAGIAGASELVREIFDIYRQNGEPATLADQGNLASKRDGGDPGTMPRARLRNQCKPKGPIGYLLESLHLQAAALDEDFCIVKAGQAKISVQKTPYQALAQQVRDMTAKSRTARA